MLDELTADQFLDRAASVIEERGHCKHQLEDDAGRVCLLGAFDVVAREQHRDSVIYDGTYGTYAIYETIRRAALEALWEEADRPASPYEERSDWIMRSQALVDWNNADERTADEVIDHMRWAAKRLRAGA